MPGCGKSTIGRQLARVRQLSFLDADHEIERFVGCTVRDFFEREGEIAFRDIEERVIAEILATKTDFVLATGGGAILRETTRRALHARSTVVYLRAAPDELARRLSRDTQRPLLQVADPRQRLRELFAQRDPLYRDAAHLAVDTGHRTSTMVVNLLSMQLDLRGDVAQDVE